MLRKPADVLNRDRAWHALARGHHSASPELIFVRGRRRAGKSFLLTHFVRVAGGVYYQATRRTAAEQLATLTELLSAHFADPALAGRPFARWEDLLRYVVARAGAEPFVLVLDEFPYLAEADPALPSVLQSWWDHDLAGTRLKVVLSGSHVSAMKRLTEADQPLYGRRTGLVQLDPLEYVHVADFLPDHAPEDRIRAYGIFGGLPGHLALLDPEATVAENVARHVLDPAGRLHDEAAHAFDAFLGAGEVHYSVVEAIAAGERKWQKISRRVGRASASLSRPLDWLKEMEVVEQVAPVTEYPNPSPKSAVYRLRDPYLVFWHRFVSTLRAGGTPSVLAPTEVWERHIAPRLEPYMGEVFEEVCRRFVARSRHPRLPFQPSVIGSWWTGDGQEEVDVVALGADGEVLVGECKWGRLGRDDVARLESRLPGVLAGLPAVRSVTLALFARGGVDDAVRARVDAGELLLFTPEDLFAWTPREEV